MKQIITLIAAILIFTTVINASGNSHKTSIKINAEKAVLKVTLQAAGRISISWAAAADETTTTIYEIQKKTEGGEFKTVAILMGEKYPVYSFRDKISIASGIIEYRVVTSDKNVIINTASQKLLVL